MMQQQNYRKAEKGYKVCIFFQWSCYLKGKCCAYLYVHGSNAMAELRREKTTYCNTMLLFKMIAIENACKDHLRASVPRKLGVKASNS